MEYYIPMMLAIGASQTNETAAPVVNATHAEPNVWIIVLVAVGMLALIYGLKALLMLIIEASGK